MKDQNNAYKDLTIFPERFSQQAIDRRELQTIEDVIKKLATIKTLDTNHWNQYDDLLSQVKVLKIQNEKNSVTLQKLGIIERDLESLCSMEKILRDTVQDKDQMFKAATSNIKRLLKEEEIAKRPRWRKALDVFGYMMLPFYGSKRPDSDISNYDIHRQDKKDKGKLFGGFWKSFFTVLGYSLLTLAAPAAIIFAGTFLGAPLLLIIPLSLLAARFAAPILDRIITRNTRNSTRTVQNRQALKNSIFGLTPKQYQTLEQQKSKSNRNFGITLGGILFLSVALGIAAPFLAISAPIYVILGIVLGAGAFASLIIRIRAPKRARNALIKASNNDLFGQDKKLISTIEKITQYRSFNFLRSDKLTLSESERLNKLLKEYGFNDDLFIAGKKPDANALKALEYIIEMKKELNQDQDHSVKKNVEHYQQNPNQLTQDLKKTEKKIQELQQNREQLAMVKSEYDNLQKVYKYLGPKTMTSNLEAFNSVGANKVKVGTIKFDSANPNYWQPQQQQNSIDTTKLQQDLEQFRLKHRQNKITIDEKTARAQARTYNLQKKKGQHI